jgi:hypothetical protein
VTDSSGPEGAVATAGTADDVGTDREPGAGPDDDGAAQPRPSPADGDGEGGRRTLLTVAGATAVLAVPIVIALVAVRTPPWYPLVDLSQIEMRVRDVGTSHPPLVGLGGRIFGLDTQGSHPGPLGFYLLAPVYRLAGSSPWALQLSAATLNLAVLAATLWAVHRRWGMRGTLLFASGLAVLMRMYGTVILLYPWNPYMPVLFWMLFLVCVWGVLSDDVVLLPVAVLAGSLCAQTHLPYVGLVGGMGGVTVAALVVHHRRGRGDPAARRRLVRWTAGSLALGLVLWLPVVVEQLGGDPGNVSVIVDSLRHPTENAAGSGTAWALLTRHLDVVALLQGDRGDVLGNSSPWVGGGLLVAWAGAAVVAVRRLRDRTLVTLHAVVLAALVLGFVTISRILGTTWFYLTLWAFGTATLTLVAVVATALRAFSAFIERRDRRGLVARLRPASLVALGVAVLVPTALLARQAPDTEDVDAEVSHQLGEVIPDVAEAIDDGTVPGGDDATYLVSWADPVNLGGPGLGLMLELERRGYDARAAAPYELSVREHRVATAAEADAEIHVAVGTGAIEEARSRPGAVEVAYQNPRTDEEERVYAGLREDVIDALVAAGQEGLVPDVDHNIFRLAADDRLPDEAANPLFTMGRMPQPLAVYAWEPAS